MVGFGGNLIMYERVKKCTSFMKIMTGMVGKNGEIISREEKKAKSKKG